MFEDPLNARPGWVRAALMVLTGCILHLTNFEWETGLTFRHSISRNANKGTAHIHKKFYQYQFSFSGLHKQFSECILLHHRVRERQLLMYFNVHHQHLNVKKYWKKYHSVEVSYRTVAIICTIEQDLNLIKASLIRLYFRLYIFVILPWRRKIMLFLALCRQFLLFFSC